MRSVASPHTLNQYALSSPSLSNELENANTPHSAPSSAPIFAHSIGILHQRESPTRDKRFRFSFTVIMSTKSNQDDGTTDDEPRPQLYPEQVKTAIQEVDQLDSSLWEGYSVDSNKAWDTKVYLDKLADDADKLRNRELTEFLEEHQKEHKLLRDRLYELENKRVAELKKHVEAAKSRLSTLIDQGPPDNGSVLDAKAQEWLDEIADTLSFSTIEDITVFIRSPDEFGMRDGGRACFGREGGNTGARELLFCVRPEYILVSNDNSLLDDDKKFTDVAAAVEDGMGSGRLYKNDSLYLAYDWNITPESDNYIYWGYYVDNMREDWEDMKEGVLEGPFTKPQLVVILEKLWSLLRKDEDTNPPKKKKPKKESRHKRDE